VHLALALTLPADERLIPATRRAIAAFLDGCRVPTEIVDDVTLALDEACSNVLKHAFPPGEPGSFELLADLRPGEVVIDVVDRGVGFNAMDSRPADDVLPLSGRGLEIMKRVMTSVEVESPAAEGGTRLRLRKQLPLHSGG
jgi:serine/threonine-protein kinase RsbW